MQVVFLLLIATIDSLSLFYTKIKYLVQLNRTWKDDNYILNSTPDSIVKLFKYVHNFRRQLAIFYFGDVEEWEKMIAL